MPFKDGKTPGAEQQEGSAERKIGFNELMSGLEHHIKSLYENNDNPTFEGAMSNFLTSVFNKTGEEGGFSVNIENDEIFISQHPEAGDFEKTISLKKDDYQSETE